MQYGKIQRRPTQIWLMRVQIVTDFSRILSGLDLRQKEIEPLEFRSWKLYMGFQGRLIG